MILAAAMLAQVLLTPPKVSPVQEPLVRELLQVTNARQRARDVIRTVLSFNNYQSMPAIRVDRRRAEADDRLLPDAARAEDDRPGRAVPPLRADPRDGVFRQPPSRGAPA